MKSSEDMAPARNATQRIFNYIFYATGFPVFPFLAGTTYTQTEKMKRQSQRTLFRKLNFQIIYVRSMSFLLKKTL